MPCRSLDVPQRPPVVPRVAPGLGPPSTSRWSPPLVHTDDTQRRQTPKHTADHQGSTEVVSGRSQNRCPSASHAVSRGCGRSRAMERSVQQRPGRADRRDQLEQAICARTERGHGEVRWCSSKTRSGRARKLAYRSCTTSEVNPPERSGGGRPSASRQTIDGNILASPGFVSVSPPQRLGHLRSRSDRCTSPDVRRAPISLASAAGGRPRRRYGKRT